MIQYFQLFCLLCWAVPVLLYLSATLRVLLSNHWSGIDAPRTVTWFMGVDQVCVIGRWWYWPDTTHAMAEGELSVWSGLFVFSGLCALGFVYVLHARAQAKKA